ncbi:hypothetical protein [Pandoraea sputorum]|uniref:hypothetical protein n=1 Tax=Pandoraea sputorum TaxID=93222 RepID=UPI0012431145|nr:hypothetical protein [Pandoraea sputorum]VVE78232.1 hypothetical protein PSP31120_01573 [Pandoraea sputorum]
MDAFAKSVYVGEIGKQCDFASSAYECLSQCIALLFGSGGTGQNYDVLRKEVFRHSHSFLTHASNVSRLLWPIVTKRRLDEVDEVYFARIGTEKKDRYLRGVVLRELYEGCPLDVLLNRELRDHLEHFDERLDDWRLNSKDRNIASDTIGPENTFSGLAPGDAMRWYDPSESTFRFRGSQYQLPPLMEAIKACHEKSAALKDILWEEICATNR